MKNKNSKYESDEKKSIMIAVIVSVIVMIAIVLAYFAVKKYRLGDSGTVMQEETMEPIQDSDIESQDGNIVVATQEELDAALADPETMSVLFQTEEEQHIVITDGDYSSIAFQIDAPLTNVDNYAVFSQVTIFRVASNTWTEKAMGNSFLIDSAACHMEIGGGALVNSIESIQEGSTLAIESDGTIKSVSLEAPSSIVSIQSDGTLEQLKVYSNTSLNLTGSQTSATDLEISYGADGAVLNTSIPISLSCYAQATISLDGGAEESMIAVNSSDAYVQVTNHTTESITVITPDGTQETLETEQTDSFGTDPSQLETETGSSSGTSSDSVKTGSSTSSTGQGRSSTSSGTSSTSGTSGTVKNGSTVTTTTTTGDSKTNASEGYTKEQVNQIVSSAVKEATQGKIDQKTADTMIEEATKDMVSKDKLEDMIQDAVDDAVKDAVDETLSKPMIVSFLEEDPIYAGSTGKGTTNQGTLPDVQSLQLPDHVVGRTYIGQQYHIPVLSWQNLDNYSTAAKSGAYRFAAILQTGTEYNIVSGARALITVYVYSAGNSDRITYQNKTYENVVSVRENDVENIQDALIGDKISYYYITNQSQTEVLYVSLNFHYYDKKGRNIAENESRWSGRYLQPGESCIAYRENPCMEYEGYFVEIDVSTSGLKAAERYCQVELADEDQVSEAATSPLELHIYKQNTQKEISECSVTLLFYGTDKDGKKTVIGVQTISTGRRDVASVNSTNENAPIIVDVVPPQDTTEIQYAVMGGYAILGQPDSTESADKNVKTAEEEQR